MFDWRFPFQNRCKIERIKGKHSVTFVTALSTVPAFKKDCPPETHLAGNSILFC